MGCERSASLKSVPRPWPSLGCSDCAVRVSPSLWELECPWFNRFGALCVGHTLKPAQTLFLGEC